MDQTERVAQVKNSQAAIAAYNYQLNQCYLVEKAGRKTLSRKDLDDETRAKAEAEMETLKANIAAWKDKRHQANRWIEKMQSESADEGLIRVISQLGKRAEIIIHYADENGKKLSYTRHIRFDGKEWTGWSTVGGGYVSYRLPGDAWAEAA